MENLDLWMILGGTVLFVSGFGSGWLAKPPKVVERVERVPYPVLQPRQKRDAEGHFLPGDNPRKKAMRKEATEPVAS